MTFGAALVAALLLAIGCAPPVVGPVPPVDEELELYDEYLRANPHDIEAYLDAAQRHWAYRGGREPVLALAELCVANNLGKPQAYLAAAMMLDMVGALRRARGYALRYTELEPRDARGWLLKAELAPNLADGYAVLEQAAAHLREVIDEAEPNVDRAEAPGGVADDRGRPEPEWWAAHLGLQRIEIERAQTLAQLQRYDEALATATQALADPRLAGLPGMWELQELAARLEARLDRFEAAEIRLQQVLAESASRPQSVRSFAWLLFLDARADEATYTLASMLRRTELPEARLTIYLCLGYAEVLAGRPERALPAVERALEIDDRSVSALLLMYQVLRLLDRDARFRDAGERLARERVARFRMPGRIATLQLMLDGVFAQHFFMLERARDSFTRAREFEPSLGWPVLALAQLEQQVENYPAAIDLYVRALDVEPALRPDVLCNIADCYFARGEYRLAIRYYNQAAEAVPTHPRAARGRQRAEAILADRAEAGVD